ncbi:MAG: ATP-binding protein [bacterium]|nr:MAG: ATP-binding protein [bacterium]
MKKVDPMFESISIEELRVLRKISIDEIENGFHYSSQEILWNVIINFVKEFNVQIFATTHSLECVKACSSAYSRLYPQEDDLRLFRIERQKDNFDVISYDNTLLESSLNSNWEVR